MKTWYLMFLEHYNEPLLYKQNIRNSPTFIIIKYINQFSVFFFKFFLLYMT